MGLFVDPLSGCSQYTFFFISMNFQWRRDVVVRGVIELRRGSRRPNSIEGRGKKNKSIWSVVFLVRNNVIN